MNAETKLIIQQAISREFPGMDSEMDIDWAIGGIFFKVGGKKAVEFIESYLVTTCPPEGKMHHIDDPEWQSIKQRLLR